MKYYYHMDRQTYVMIYFPLPNRSGRHSKKERYGDRVFVKNTTIVLVKKKKNSLTKFVVFIKIIITNSWQSS